MALLVELDMFSGRPNPTWVLTDVERHAFEERLRRAHRGSDVAPLPALGYRGFVVHTQPAVRVIGGALVWSTEAMTEESIQGEPGLEEWLLETGRPHLDRAVYEATREAIRHL